MGGRHRDQEGGIDGQVGTNCGVWQNEVALDLPVDAKKTKRCYGPQAKPLKEM